MTARIGNSLAFTAGTATLVVGALVIWAWQTRTTPEQLETEAIAARQRGEHAEAVRLYDALSELTRADAPGRSADAATEAGMLLLQSMARVGEAEDRFRVAVQAVPDHPGGLRGLAFLLAASGRRWEAVTPIRRVLWRLDDNAFDGSEVDLLRLLDLGGAARLDTAILEQALRADSTDAAALLGLAAADVASNRWDQAVRRARASLERDPGQVAAQAVIGRGLLESGRGGELVAWFGRLSDVARRDPRVWAIRGDYHDRIGQKQAAARCFWEVLKERPGHRQANYRLARLLEELGREDQAVRFRDRAKALQELKETDDQMIAAGGLGSQGLLRQKVGQLEELGRLFEAWGWARLAGVRDRQANWPREAVQRLASQLGSTAETGRLTVSSSSPALAMDLSDWNTPAWSEDALVETAIADDDTILSFRDDATASGLVFRYDNGSGSHRAGPRMPEFTGGGVAVVDYDLDGWPDLFFSQGVSHAGRLPVEERPELVGDRLFRNAGAGRFLDVTSEAGIGGPGGDGGFGQGVAAGDVDGDGWPDLLVCQVGVNQLWINNRDGTFHDGTAEWEMDRPGADRWSTSAAIADINGDGHADIYVVNYLSGEDVLTRVCRDAQGRRRLCQPFQFPGAGDRLYLGSGAGTFTDATRRLGMVSEDGKGLGVVVGDFDEDGRLEVFVANDTRANYLLASSSAVASEWRLADDGLGRGVGLNGDGRAEGSMGIAVGDSDGDGRVDLFVTNFLDETNTLYRGDGRQGGSRRFTDRTRPSRLAASSLSTLGFGTQFLDADLDGDLDLLVVNGHVDDYSDIGRPHKMLTQCYRNVGRGRFVLQEGMAQGGYFRKQILGRGLARVDWNRDGRPDAVITALDVPAVLLTNTTPAVGDSLTLRLVATDGHRDAIGTIIRLIGPGDAGRRFELTGGDGYMSSNQRVVMIGLGDGMGPETVEVAWPGRQVERFSGINAPGEWVIVEGRGRAVLLKPGIARR